MLRQQHFLHQRKNLYNQLSLRSSSSEPYSDDNHRSSWMKFFLSHHCRTLYHCQKRGKNRPARASARRAVRHSLLINKKWRIDWLINAPVWKTLEEFMVILRGSSDCVMEQKCIVWALASYALFRHVFSRMKRDIVFPNSEAVSMLGVWYCLSVKYIFIY